MDINIKDYFKIDDSHSKIRGFIFAYENGKLVFHKENMITEGGRKLIFNRMHSDSSIFNINNLSPKVGSGTIMTSPLMEGLSNPITNVKIESENITFDDSTLCATYNFKVKMSDTISESNDYILVTSELDDWSGEYLIVYSDGPYCFNGSLKNADGDKLDSAQNYTSVTINNNTISYDDNSNYHFKIEKIDNNKYSIKSASGYYIGANGSSNELDASNTTPYPNTIQYLDGNHIISGADGSYLQFYVSGSQSRFRYYDDKKNKPIQLYKRNKSRETVSDYSTKISELGLFYKEDGKQDTMFSRVVFQPYTLTHETTLEFKYYIYF